MNFLDPRLPERFWAKCVPEPNSGCWLWIGADQGLGYGRIAVPDRRAARPAHAVAYEALVGPIAKGLEIDHLCRTPACCNPAHLEPVTHAENLHRSPIMGLKSKLRGAMITHCAQGHPFDAVNTYRTPAGKRQCRTCTRIRALARYHRNRKEQR
jgi:hypothetical protein